MSHISTYFTTALCLVPAVAMVQPARAGAEESHKLASQYIKYTEKMTEALEMISQDVNDSFTEIVSIIGASYSLMADEVGNKLCQETGLTKEDSNKIDAMHKNCLKSLQVAMTKIRKTPTAELNPAIRSFLLILSNKNAAKGSAEEKAVAQACSDLLIISFKQLDMLLGVVKDAETAKKAGAIISELELHSAVLAEHLSATNPELFEELAKELPSIVPGLVDKMKALKKKNYYGCKDLRDFCESKL